MGGSASGGVSESQSKPLNAEERSAIFQGAMQNLAQMNPTYITRGGTAPSQPYSSPPPRAVAQTQPGRNQSEYWNGGRENSNSQGWFQNTGTNAPSQAGGQQQGGNGTLMFTPPQYSAPGYVSPESVSPSQYTSPGAYTGPGSARTLSGGDYEKLQQSMLQGNTAGLDAAWKNRSKEIDQNMADRGLWSSGVAEKAKQQDYAQNWTPAYQQAAANATQQRYAMQNAEQQGLNALESQNANARNTYNLANANAANTYGLTAEQMRAGNAQQNANARNTFNLANSNAGYQSMWQPLNYLAGIWNGTGGQTSSGSSVNASGGFSL